MAAHVIVVNFEYTSFFWPMVTASYSVGINISLVIIILQFYYYLWGNVLIDLCIHTNVVHMHVPFVT